MDTGLRALHKETARAGNRYRRRDARCVFRTEQHAPHLWRSRIGGARDARPRARGHGTSSALVRAARASTPLPVPADARHAAAGQPPPGTECHAVGIVAWAVYSTAVHPALGRGQGLQSIQRRAYALLQNH